MRLSDLQSKKIVSVTTGRNLGNIGDINIMDDGKVESLTIECNRNFFSLNKESDTRIFWSEIVKIGEDVILVKKE